MMKILITALLGCGLIPGISIANESGYEQKPFAWTGGMGLSYPLVASVTGGINVPLVRDPENPGSDFSELAVQANVDLGIGGGMVAGGLYVPFSSSQAAVSATIFKAAALRTWLVDLGVDHDRTYKGGMVEVLDTAAGMSMRYGIGYFRSPGSTHVSSDNFIYLYVGVGL